MTTNQFSKPNAVLRPVAFDWRSGSIIPGRPDGNATSAGTTTESPYRANPELVR